MEIYQVSTLNTESAVLSSFTGQILDIFRNHVMPPKFFRDEYCAISEAWAAMLKSKGRNTGGGSLRVPQFPLLYVEPNYEIAESTTDYLEKSVRSYNNLSGVVGTGLFTFPVFFDDEADIGLRALGIRRRYSFVVRLVMDSESRALNVLSRIRQRLPVGRIQQLYKKPAEYVIPNEIIAKLAEVKGWNHRTEVGAELIRSYMNAYSEGTINDVILKSTGLRAITYVQHQNYLVNVENIGIANVNSRRGQAKDPRVSVDIGMWLESVVPSDYVLSSVDFSNFVPRDPIDSSEDTDIEATGALVSFSIAKHTPSITRGSLTRVFDAAFYFESVDDDGTVDLSVLFSDGYDLLTAYREMVGNDFGALHHVAIYPDRFAELAPNEFTVDWNHTPSARITIHAPRPNMRYRVVIWLSLTEANASLYRLRGIPYEPPLNQSYVPRKAPHRYVRGIQLQPIPNGVIEQFMLPADVLVNWKLEYVIQPQGCTILENGRGVVFQTPPDEQDTPLVLEALVSYQESP